MTPMLAVLLWMRSSLDTTDSEITAERVAMPGFVAVPMPKQSVAVVIDRCFLHARICTRLHIIAQTLQPPEMGKSRIAVVSNRNSVPENSVCRRLVYGTSRIDCGCFRQHLSASPAVSDSVHSCNSRDHFHAQMASAPHRRARDTKIRSYWVHRHLGMPIAVSPVPRVLRSAIDVLVPE